MTGELSFREASFMTGVAAATACKASSIWAVSSALVGSFTALVICFSPFRDYV